MSSTMKTLFLNPPSFKGFDGGSSARYPATREIPSYWYPVWLSYPAGILEGSRLLDACPHNISLGETVHIARNYDFVVLFTSTVGFQNDCLLARLIKESTPDVKIAFVGPPVQAQPAETLLACEAIDFVVRGEFDYPVVEYAQGHPLDRIQNVCFRKNGKIVLNPMRPQLQTEDLDRLPFSSEVYHRNLVIENYNIPYLLHPYISFYSSRGCPALCTFCLWPQTLSGHTWRVRSVENVISEVRQALRLFPQLKEIFFDDDTFNIRKDRVQELCRKFKPLGFRWSSTARVHCDYETLKAMADAGARLFIVGLESGDPQILKNIKKGTTLEMAKAFARNCKKVGIKIHGDFIIGLPGETQETIQRTIEYAKELDVETVQVSIAHAFPGTELYDFYAKNNYMVDSAAADEEGHQLPHIEMPGLTREEMMAAVTRFYDEYYFRPRVVWRLVKDALWSGEERRRLYHEATSFLRLRAERLKYVREGAPSRTMVRVPANDAVSGQ
ncbi:MAG: hopanoid biosynthesis associated radical SAM protein HpnJ [Terriglobia bacterium]